MNLTLIRPSFGALLRLRFGNLGSLESSHLPRMTLPVAKPRFPLGRWGQDAPLTTAFSKESELAQRCCGAGLLTPRAREGVIQAGFMALFIYDCFSLEYSLFTMLYSFLLNNNMNQL